MLIKQMGCLSFLVAAAMTGNAMAQAIYTCTDAKGRKLTSDRPIAECVDRAQQEMSPQGTVKRVLGPTLTAQERAVQDDKDKAALAVRLQAEEAKRRDRAMLSRFPNKVAHDKERSQAVELVDEVIKTGAKRIVELGELRVAINTDYEFYKKDPSKAPLALKRRLEENDSSILAQQRFIYDQDLLKSRVNLRFDEELIKLKGLWALANAPVGGTAKP